MNLSTSQAPNFDLFIQVGRIHCPASGLDTAGAVAVSGDRIVAVGADVSGVGRQTLDEPNAVLLPGLIDLHAHPAKSGSMFGIDPDQHLLPRGTTTALSQGDAGADRCETFIRETIEASRTQVLLAINLSATGELGPGGCFERIESLDVAACVAAIERHRRHVWGVSVNVSHHCCGRTDPREVLQRGLLVAEQTGFPILYGMRRPEDWPLADQLRWLRPGDVVTYCFRRSPHCIVRNGRVIPEVREAQDRGLLFDVGHGLGSFDFEVAETALQDGFLPDSLSTDLQRGHIGETPTHDLPLVMSKLQAAGMLERDIFRAVTTQPANTLRLADEIGSLRIGTRADLVLLRRRPEGELLVDVNGQTRVGRRWETVATIRSTLPGTIGIFPSHSPFLSESV